jgi:hypothetical protein
VPLYFAHAFVVRHVIRSSRAMFCDAAPSHFFRCGATFVAQIFDWDNIFATYMTSLSSKEIAYSNFIQVIRSKTALGFVPNFSAGGSKSIDRTEPPIGAKVLLEMYKKFKDLWIVELLFDDLLAWNDWFVDNRMLGPLGIVSLGSDTIDGYHDFSPGTMQGARFESGLDNSPM